MSWISNYWVAWLALNAAIGIFFVYALLAPASAIKSSLLPGTTTHGHYQIELKCSECHISNDEDSQSVGALMQDACNRCHSEQLKNSKDTHPAKKFNDPTNADLLQILDAQDCLTCHVEHVPDQTNPMGLTIPTDYCWHCHQDVAETRPSHEGMAFDSCATAGCHNYHDNRALYEKYLHDHFGEPDLLDSPRLPTRDRGDVAVRGGEAPGGGALDVDFAKFNDAPESKSQQATLVTEWENSAHGQNGVSCRACHTDDVSDPHAVWSDSVSHETCGTCHEKQLETFYQGKHGMRLASGLSPMQPSMARHPMHGDSAHRELDCNACHRAHRDDTRWAAVDACLQCHADKHSLAYADTQHAALWQQEVAGEVPSGTGVTCASCHLPRQQDGDIVWVNHDQNSTLRPNESMARDVCQHCHSLEYSLSALADPELLNSCYGVEPSVRTKSVQMAHDWFVEQERKRDRRRKAKSTK